MSNNNFDPVQEKHETHEKLIARFGSIEAYFEFVLKRQEEQIKQGVKYVDFSFHRAKRHGNVSLGTSFQLSGNWDPVGALEPLVEGFTRKSVNTPSLVYLI